MGAHFPTYNADELITKRVTAKAAIAQAIANTLSARISKPDAY
jgi:hypothetical protein